VIHNFLFLFLYGISMSLGPCLVNCGPLLFALIGGERVSPLEGIKRVLLFSSGRIFVYLLLGCLAGRVGEYITHLRESIYPYILWTGGFLLIFIGIFFLIPFSFLCPLKEKREKFKGSYVLLGLLWGLLPCLPLTSVLLYIALISRNLLQGFLYSLSFSLGTLISPLLAVGGLAGWISSRITRERSFWIFRIFLSILLMIMGFSLLIETM